MGQKIEILKPPGWYIFPFRRTCEASHPQHRLHISVNAPWRYAAMANNVAGCFWAKRTKHCKANTTENSEEPKDPSPAHLVC